MQQINTSKAFRSAILKILEKQQDRYSSSLEAYLRSLWMLVNQYKNTTVTYALLVKLLEEAFLTTPPDFNHEWLRYEKPISWNYKDGTYVIEKLENHKIIIVERNVDTFRILKHTILFQIADLYRMRDKQLKDEYRYFGVQSPTGNSWYNFDVFTYLKCSTGGIQDHTQHIEVEFTDCDWAVLAGILELGRLYE